MHCLTLSVQISHTRVRFLDIFLSLKLKLHHTFQKTSNVKMAVVPYSISILFYWLLYILRSTKNLVISNVCLGFFLRLILFYQTFAFICASIEENYCYLIGMIYEENAS